MLSLNQLEVNFDKYSDGLVPAIVQDDQTLRVLMLGFMNQEAVQKTLQEGKVTFYSRSKKRLWTKGEESGHFLYFKSMRADCDQDTLLVKATPAGPVCHTGADTCWGEKNEPATASLDNTESGTDQPTGFLNDLEDIIRSRRESSAEKSYVASLFGKGLNKIAQKVGEEAVELVIEAKDNNQDLFLNEAADLLFHYLLLLQAKDCSLQDVVRILEERHSKKAAG
ncbi:MAG: bifunctional phosphoribosyl-AMP cyclohydrolase/phosphoribosyl-ATP diphosphatase HisIE [Williamsia sp.]|nr:bifunctional phosphoribosyl-AMP cyclohydrolase/phosphoribosyl-ATP diphosphatase HisIE [Williamsia sp.]